MFKKTSYSKQFTCFLLFILTTFLSSEAFGQIHPGSQGTNSSRKYADPVLQTFDSTRAYYLAVLTQPNALPGKILRQINDSIFIIELESKLAFKKTAQQAIVVPAIDDWKLSPALEQWKPTDKLAKKKYILKSPDVNGLLELLAEKHQGVIVLSVNTPSNSVVVKTTGEYIATQLLKLKQIIFVDAAAEARSETRIIGYDRSFHGISALDYQLPGANGKNIVAGVKEQKMEDQDLDLWKRVAASSLGSAATSYHATVISSIIGGAGNSFYDGRGIAWGCRFFSSSFDNLFADDAAVLNSNNVSVQNHSYGTVIQQFYGAEALSYDLLTWSSKSFVPVISAGNQGEASATQGRYSNLPGFANLTGNFKMAKNVITVGAIDGLENVPAQSSTGPMYDGRLAPQLAALGPNGTSDAAAIVSGTIAVMQQVYKDSNNSLPSASLTKAILYNTAEDIYSPGIDYKTGYGLVNSLAAVKATQQKNYDAGTITNGAGWTKTITVPAGAAALKVTLAWTDSAAQVNNSKALLNDLDLEVLQVGNNSVYLPWVLSTAANADSLKKEPVRKRDSLNTAEQVSIALPAAGSYQVKVKGTAINSSSAAFHIAYNIDTLNTFAFTSPVHASDVLRQENEKSSIRWKTFVADSLQTGDLSISYNNGLSWQLLAQPKLAAKKFVWAVKDTNAVARLKMQTTFGSFTSNPFFVGNLTTLRVDFNCADSFGLSWNKQPLANSYRLYTLTDSPYLKNIQTLADTFVVLNRLSNPSLVYAVEPVLAFPFPAARSVAIDISFQAVNCFYRALNYNLLDENKLKLILELSLTRYADSIFFEQVTAGGQLLQQYAGYKVNPSVVTYPHIVNELPAGLIYVRAGIKLASGATIYTDIIPVLTSGARQIYFYPNPVSRASTLTYSLRQGVSTSAKLQLFDITGRLLISYASMPGAINASNLPPGVIIYKLLSSENKLLETGKLIVF